MVQASVHAAASLNQLRVLDRLAISAYGLSFYLWKMVVPVNLSPLYELPGKLDPWAIPFVQSYGVVLAVTALALACRRRWPGLLAAWGAYVVILLPVLGIFQSGPQIAADRYTYLAGLGWALLAGGGLLSASRRLPLLSTGLAFFLLLGLGPVTWNQIHVWHDSEKLWSHAVAIDSGSPVGHYSWGLALAQQGKLSEAMEHYQTALRLKPDYADAHNNVGAVLADQGKLAEASEHYQRALQIRPEYAQAHYNLGAALAQQGKPAEAIAHYRQALRIKPDDALAHTNWGVELAEQGKLLEAIEHFREALRIKPDYALAHRNLGQALTQQSNLTEASEHFQQAGRAKK
jgi:tetratricopeptide (TPR) repeat protein